ncbi:MAG: hypothetical protein ACLVGL_15480 [Waltera sp.]
MQTELFVVGELGRQYFTGQQIGFKVTEQFHYTAQNPDLAAVPRWIAEIAAWRISIRRAAG